MAYQVGSTCYATATEAAQAQASTMVGAIVGQAGTAHTVSATTMDETSITYVLSPVGGGTPITHVAPFTPQPCNMLQMEDGLSIGWMIAGAWIGAYCLLFLARVLRGETGTDYGNT
jgi:hypothetical protein